MASYDGAPGRTRKQRVHYTCPDGTVVVADVYVSVDADADPELAQRLMAEDPAAGLNVVRCPGERAPRAIAVPVVYHAPGNEIIVLVLPESCRHRELHERATLMSVMAEDTAVPVPAYARDFRVVYGGAGLRSLLEGEAERALAARREAEQSAELAARAAEVERREQAVGDQQAELDRLAAQLDKSQRDLDVLSETLVEREAALDRRSAELERTTAEMATLAARAREAQAAPIEPVADESPPVMTSAPRPRPDEPPPPANETVPYQTVSPAELLDARAIPVETHDEHTDAIDADLDAISLEEGEVIAADQVVGEGVPAVSAGAPVSQDGETRIGGTTDVAIERWIVSRDKYLKLVDDAGLVRLAICADGEELELLMGERLGLKIQLHPLPSYPLVTVTFGSPAVVRGDEHGPSPVFFFDVKAADDRAVLDALSNAFTFRFELFDSEHLPVKKRTVTAELAENVRYILAAADARLTELAPAEASFDRAIIAYDAPDYDRLGARHRERREFRPDKLDKLARESEVRRAMAIVRRFSLPELEEYLVAIRGYPLPQWRRERRAVLERAIEVGLWVGRTLSKVAISEGVVSSRAELVKQLSSNFTRTVAAGDHDLDDDTIDDNWNDLEKAGEQHGVDARPPTGRASSEFAPVASGTIGQTGPRKRTSVTGVTPVVQGSVEQLVKQLEEDHRRLESAIELARRGEERAVGPVFNALRRMTRGEAVRLLGFAVGFGDGATPHLIDGLRSRKSYLRQGCALALALIGSDKAVEAVCDQLVAEPTEIWQEIARGLGQVGPGAMMSLAARLSGHGERGQERVAWAMAHIGARGDDKALSDMANGRDVAASAAARRALELIGHAQVETAAILGPDAPPGLTVNGAFSRSFFEAAESIMPGAAPALARDAAELTGPAMLLDESDLIEAPEFEDAEPLDESDLIPT